MFDTGNQGSFLYLSIIINILAFVVLSFFPATLPIFSLDSDSSNQPWQIFTFNFVHLSTSHILFNLVIAYLIGRWITKWYSPSQQLLIYFGSPLLIGLINLAIFQYFPQASAGYSGVCFTLMVIYIYNVKSLIRPFITQVTVLHLLFFIFDIPLSYVTHLVGALVGIIICGLLHTKDKCLPLNHRVNGN